VEVPLSNGVYSAIALLLKAASTRIKITVSLVPLKLITPEHRLHLSQLQVNSMIDDARFAMTIGKRKPLHLSDQIVIYQSGIEHDQEVLSLIRWEPACHKLLSKHLNLNDRLQARTGHWKLCQSASPRSL
jgi:hypothetical protein